MRRQGTAALTLGALGVVYGDIGTSPLYTMKEVLDPANGVQLIAPDIIGAVSTILWALMLVVTLKYVVLILRADNRGEGGIMALTALAVRAAGGTPARRKALLLTGVCGAALFYGDSVITPAISVLGAVEGLETVTPVLKPFVVPLSVVVLLALFVMQRRGTATSSCPTTASSSSARACSCRRVPRRPVARRERRRAVRTVAGALQWRAMRRASKRDGPVRDCPRREQSPAFSEPRLPQHIDQHRRAANRKRQQQQEPEVRRDRAPPHPQCLNQIGVHDENSLANISLQKELLVLFKDL